jgi:predicted phosphodiesterase
VRTLVVSDLHLGARLQRDVLRRPEALDALLDALDAVDRLVLLGDVVELQEGRARQMIEVAGPVLRAIGARLGPGREVIWVPGNHDGELIRPWLRQHGVPSAVDARIPQDATPMLAHVTAWLAPADVRVHYPGVWLSERVWATHGHYLDRHLLPDSAYGMTRGPLRRRPRDRVSPSEYEHPRSTSLSRVEDVLRRRLPRPLAALAQDAAEYLRAATMPGVPRALRSHRFAPLTALLLGFQMQRASIPAIARVVHRLGGDADWVVFGHVHRSGPLAGDDPRLWQGPEGAPKIANTGSWVHEQLLLHDASAPHPYWPGGAILLEDDRDPRPLGLLDHLDAAALRHRGDPAGGPS